MKDKNISFGLNLKALRKKHGYTRAKLAKMIDFSEKSIEKWEYNNALPSMETVCKLSELFGITIDSLVYNQKTEIKYLLAIDGGGSKTEFLLTDTDKNEISRITLGTSNPVDVGMEIAKKTLEQGIEHVCLGIKYREISAFAGLAGGITGNNKQQIEEFLSQFGFGFCDNGSDTESALEIALKGEDGVAVIMGTGIIAFSQYDGNRHRIGGWGYHIDKGGSGYNLGSEALNFALKHKDGRNGSKILCELIENKLQKPLEECISSIYSGGKAFVASFAPVVFEAYDKGDEAASEIIDKNVKEVAEIIAAGQKFLPDGKGRIVICGGLTSRKDILNNFFEKYLSKTAKIEFSDEPIINGALLLSEKLKKEKKYAENRNAKSRHI